jgi:2-haloacid dehalogenase
MSTAWVNRTGGPYPGYFTPPRHVVDTLAALPAELSR